MKIPPWPPKQFTRSQPDIILSIEENAHAFLNEAIKKALQAVNDPMQWQFAILHLVQSLELSLKSLLRQIHPVLIYANIDEPKNTVTLSRALDRLQSDNIGRIKLTPKELAKLDYIIALRNAITHANFTLIQQQAEKEFFEVFMFIVHFQRKHLNRKIQELIPADNLSSLIHISRVRKSLLTSARTRLRNEEITGEFLLTCPSCQEETFVCKDNINACYLCHHHAAMERCRQCERLWFADGIRSFEEYVDLDQEGEENVAVNKFGYTTFKACGRCYPDILDDIAEKRRKLDEVWEKHYEYLMSQMQDHFSEQAEDRDDDPEGFMADEAMREEF